MARPWRDTGGGHSKALGTVQQDFDGLVSELANLWRSPDLTADEAMMRATSVQAQVEPILQAEKRWLGELREQLSQSREATKGIALHVGEPIPVEFGKQSILEQMANLQLERARLIEAGERQKEELRELVARIERECKRLAVDVSSYAVDPDATGIAAVRAANQHLRHLDVLEKERVANLRSLRSQISGMVERLGETLEFRLAHAGELTGCDDGIVVLENSEENKRFVADVTEFATSENASSVEGLAFERQTRSLQRVIDVYSQELATKKTQKRPRSGSRSRSYSYSCSRSRSPRADRGSHRPESRRQDDEAQVAGSDGSHQAYQPPPQPPPNGGWRPPGQEPPSGFAPPAGFGYNRPPGALPPHVGYGPPPPSAYGPPHDPQHAGHPPPHHMGYYGGHPPPQHLAYNGHPPPHGHHPPPQHAGYEGGPPPAQHAGYEGGHPPPHMQYEAGRPPAPHMHYDAGHAPPPHGAPPHPGYDAQPPPAHAAYGGGHAPPVGHAPPSGYGPPPGYGGPPPAYGGSAPPAGYYGQPPAGHPGYDGGPPPGYGAPPPGYGAPPPGYGGPPPGYGAPPPDYGAPPPGYGAPPPDHGGQPY